MCHNSWNDFHCAWMIDCLWDYTLNLLRCAGGRHWDVYTIFCRFHIIMAETVEIYGMWGFVWFPDSLSIPHLNLWLLNIFCIFMYHDCQYCIFPVVFVLFLVSVWNDPFQFWLHQNILCVTFTLLHTFTSHYITFWGVTARNTEKEKKVFYV